VTRRLPLDTESSRKAPGRNDPCPCGSGKKYKQCCLAKDEATAREARAKAAAEAPAEAAAEPGGGAAPAPGPRPRPKAPTSQPWKRGAANTKGFQRTTATRKVGGGA
jgi:hypothetical protein